MWLLLISIFIWIAILIYNTVYRFLPINLQSVLWIRVSAIIVATVVLLGTINQAVQGYKNYRFAYISSKDGRILKKKNFPWEVTKTITREQNIVFIINERYGDASQVTVVLDKPRCKYAIYNAIDGVGVKFLCLENDIPNFKIIITN